MQQLRGGCAAESEKNCNHSDEERMIKGTWVVYEVRLALEFGCQLVETYKCWSYDITQYDPKEKTGGLFADYFNANLKGEIEASGWPECCHSEKKAFVEKMHAQGVEIEPKHMCVNSGLRSLCKLCLKCPWGKFSVRQSSPT